VTLTGPHRHKNLAELGDYDVGITTYPLLWRDQDELATRELHLLILDEAHSVKNPAGSPHEAVRRLKARTRVALSGTPIENHLGELWAIMDILNPGCSAAPTTSATDFRIRIGATRHGAASDPCAAVRRTSCAAPREHRRQGSAAQDRDRPRHRARRPSGPTRASASPPTPTSAPTSRTAASAVPRIAILDALLRLRGVLRSTLVSATRPSGHRSAKYTLCST